MPLAYDAQLKWFDAIKRKELIDLQPKWVKVRVVCAFTVGPDVYEEFWCKVHILPGGNKKPIRVSVDNDLDYTADHGLQYDDPLEIKPQHIMEIRQ